MGTNNLTRNEISKKKGFNKKSFGKGQKKTNSKEMSQKNETQFLFNVKHMPKIQVQNNKTIKVHSKKRNHQEKNKKRNYQEKKDCEIQNAKSSPKVQGLQEKKPQKGIKRKFSGELNLTKKKFKSNDKQDEENKSVDSKKNKLFLLKKKERKIFRKKQKMKEKFERSKELKALWEPLRKHDCKQDHKNDLLEKVFKLIKGHAKELSLAHDTVRVLECAFGLGNDDQKETLFEELKDHILLLAKSKYGKFLILKILRTGLKKQKTEIISKMHSNVIQLLSHSVAAEVVEMAFNECASGAQRTQLVQEFYGPSFKYFKEDISLKQLLEKEPERSSSVIQHMKTALVKLLQKSVIKHSIVHFILREFLICSDNTSRSEIIEAVRPVLVEMLHSKDGARAAMHCIWHGTVKDRKSIIKTFKSHVSKIAVEEHGHLVLLSIFDAVDDTKIVKKIIITELLKDLQTIMQNLYGRKVFLYLISPRNTIHFCPDIINILSEGDHNEASKKDSSIRKSELKETVVQPLMEYVSAHITEKYEDNSFCLTAFAILKGGVGYTSEAFHSISKLAAIPYSSDLEKAHFIESLGSNVLLKKLILEDKNSNDEECFSLILVKSLTKGIIQSWTGCNRGCFLLINLLETEIDYIVQTIQKSLCNFLACLSKQSSSGASILLKKIQQ